MMVGRCWKTFLLGWYIFRGYVKLPGASSSLTGHGNMCLWNSLCFLSEIFAWIFSQRSLKSPVSQPKKKASTSTTSPQSAGFFAWKKQLSAGFNTTPPKKKLPHPVQKPGLGRCFSFSKEVVLASKCWV